jgi:hypothetical protein
MVGSEAMRQIHIVLKASPDSDQEELDALTTLLREQLLELDVERVELDRAKGAPDGAKPGDVIALGALVATVAPFALRSVVRLLETWIKNRPVRSVSITVGDDQLEVQAVAAADQRRLIDAFIAAHESPPPLPAQPSDSAPSSAPGSDTAERA